MSELDPTRTRILRDDYVKALKKLPKQAQKRVLQLAAAGITEKDIEEIKNIISQEISPKQAEQAIKKYTQQAYQRGAEKANSELRKLGIEISIPSKLIVIDEATLNVLENMSMDLVTGLSADTKKELARELREGLLSGEGSYKLKKRISKVFKMSTYRAEMIARTETIRSFNAAAWDRYRRVGVKKFRWIAALDERMCVVCGAKDGEVFRGTDQRPPAHPNCRCAIIPIFTAPRKAPVEGKKNPIPKVTGNEAIDTGISTALKDFDMALREEGNYSRALNRTINGKLLSIDDSTQIGKGLYKDYIRGASRKNLKPTIQSFLPLKVNSNVIEAAGNLKIGYQPYGRASYFFEKRKMTLIRGEEEWRTFLHEYGHHLEAIEGNRKAAQEFFRARVRNRGYRFKPLRDFSRYAGRRYLSGEYAFEGFEAVDPYAGKIYPLGKTRAEINRVSTELKTNPKRALNHDFTTELVSMGLQNMKNEETISNLADTDREYFGLMLALLRGDFL